MRLPTASPIAVANSPACAPLDTASDALDAWSPVVLGLIGTLLLHACFVSWAILGTRAPSAAPYAATGSDGDALLLLLPTSTVNVDVRRLNESSPQKWLPPTPMVSPADLDPLPALRIDARQPEVAQPSATRVDRITFIKTCRETYPDERHLNEDLATVSLQGSHVEISGGDRQRALMALHCLQALGTLEVAAVGHAVGS